jgi:hypothetical protein
MVALKVLVVQVVEVVLTQAEVLLILAVVVAEVVFQVAQV